MKNKKRITAQERDLLALFKAEGLSNKECARRLNRHPSVIGRELKRNSFKASDGTWYYVAIHAQAKAEEREWKLAHAKQELKNPANVWQGVVLEESLGDKSFLNLAKIVGTDIDKLEEEDKVMTFHKIEVNDAERHQFIL